MKKQNLWIAVLISGFLIFMICDIFLTFYFINFNITPNVVFFVFLLLFFIRFSIGLMIFYALYNIIKRKTY